MVVSVKIFFATQTCDVQLYHKLSRIGQEKGSKRLDKKMWGLADRRLIAKAIVGGNYFVDHLPQSKLVSTRATSQICLDIESPRN